MSIKQPSDSQMTMKQADIFSKEGPYIAWGSGF